MKRVSCYELWLYTCNFCRCALLILISLFAHFGVLSILGFSQNIYTAL